MVAPRVPAPVDPAAKRGLRAPCRRRLALEPTASRRSLGSASAISGGGRCARTRSGRVPASAADRKRRRTARSATREAAAPSGTRSRGRPRRRSLDQLVRAVELVVEIARDRAGRAARGCGCASRRRRARSTPTSRTPAHDSGWPSFGNGLPLLDERGREVERRRDLVLHEDRQGHVGEVGGAVVEGDDYARRPSVGRVAFRQ